MKIIYLPDIVRIIITGSIELQKSHPLEKIRFKITKDGIRYGVVED